MPRIVTDQTFADFGVQPEICAALAGAGITHPFPIQAMTLPVALQGADIIGQAKTGTGKTLGFGIPLVQRVVGPGMPGFEELEGPGKPQALVVAPTRELALQVAEDLTTAAKRLPVRVHRRSSAAARTSRRSRRCAPASRSSWAPPAASWTWSSRATWT